jgi:hypothetical protein
VSADDDDLFSTPAGGLLVMPGTYRVRMLIRQQGQLRAVDGAEQEFRVVMHGTTITEDARKELYEFQRDVYALKRAVAGTLETAQALDRRLNDIRRAIDETPTLSSKERGLTIGMEARLRAIMREVRGDVVLRQRNENTPASISDRVNAIIDEQYYALAPVTKTHRQLYAEASESLVTEQEKLRTLMEKDLKDMEKVLDAAGAPWTTGRLPLWKGK